MAHESKKHLTLRQGGPNAAVAARKPAGKKPLGQQMMQPLQPMQMPQGSTPIHPLALYFAMLQS